MVSNGDRRQRRMLVVHARCGGFHVALVPSALLQEQVEAALNEVGVEVARRP